MNETTIQTIVLNLIRAKATLTKQNADILERKIDGVMMALMRGQVLNAGVMADEAAAFLAAVN
jgi:hypothetical protein